MHALAPSARALTLHAPTPATATERRGQYCTDNSDDTNKRNKNDTHTQTGVRYLVAQCGHGLARLGGLVLRRLDFGQTSISLTTHVHTCTHHRERERERSGQLRRTHASVSQRAIPAYSSGVVRAAHLPAASSAATPRARDCMHRAKSPYLAQQ